MSTLTGSRKAKAPAETMGPAAQEAIRPLERADAETRIVLRDVGWEVYDTLSEAIGERQRVRLVYDGKDLEIMTTSRFHEFFKELFGQFVVAVSEELKIPRSAAGETTWKRPELSRGLEADECY